MVLAPWGDRGSSSSNVAKLGGSSSGNSVSSRRSPLIASSVTFCCTRIGACSAWPTAVTVNSNDQTGKVAGLLDGDGHQTGGDPHRERQRLHGADPARPRHTEPAGS